MKTFTDKYGDEFTTDRKDQIAFIEAMEEAGIEWSLYSGRGMYGAVCPSVSTGRHVDEYDLAEAYPKVFKLHQDSMGLGKVFYAR